MRIVMPLFQFRYLDSEPFHFSGKEFRIDKFDSVDEIPEVDIFSKYDVDHMHLESWAVVFENDDIEKYKIKINMLLLSFRIFSKGKPPFIKYRLCKENIKKCSRLSTPMTYIHEFEKDLLPHSVSDLERIDQGFKALIEMDAISYEHHNGQNCIEEDPTPYRCHNALYFMYLAIHTTHWIDSFMFLMSTLEAIFSKDKRKGATKTICTRVSSFLESKPRCEYTDIDHLYDIRSRIVHGNIMAKKDPGKNLKELHHLQYIVIECMKKILQEKVCLKFIDKKTRDSYLGTLNVSR